MLVPAAFVILWELCARAGLVDAQLIPAPSQVVQTWWIWIFGASGPQHSIYVGNWLVHAGASTRRVLTGFAIAAAVGVPIGILIGWYKLAENLLDPLIQMIRPIPISARIS